MTCGSNRRLDRPMLGTNSGRKSKVSSLGSAAIGAFALSFIGIARPGSSGAGTGGTVGADEGIEGTAGAPCAPGTCGNEKNSFIVGKDGAPDKGEIFAPSRKYALAPGTAGGFAVL